MALGAAAVVMSGCWWGQPGYDSHHSGHNALASAITPSNAADVDREWSTAVPGITGTPVQSQAGLVHVTSTSGGLGNPTVGEVLAIRPATGQVAWRTPLAALHADAHPQLVASGDQLFVATFNSLTAPAGRLHRIDAATGSIIDSTPIGAAAAHEQIGRAHV